MDKAEFTNELKDLSHSMTRAELEKAITALNECRSRIHNKDSREKSAISRLLSTTERNEADLIYMHSAFGRQGTIRAFGASLLTYADCCELKGKWSDVPYWLYEGYRVKDGKIDFWPGDKGACIRPVLILDDIKRAGLSAGDNIKINEETFLLIGDHLALALLCLDELCTFKSRDYSHSIIKYCVDGWYAHLLKENKMWADDET